MAESSSVEKAKVVYAIVFAIRILQRALDEDVITKPDHVITAFDCLSKFFADLHERGDFF